MLSLRGSSSARDGSIAVWCKNNSDRTAERFEAHFNYWHLRGDRSFDGTEEHIARDFLEIGILITQPAMVDHISIFVPVKCSLADIDDCSEHFQHPAIAEGVFNEALFPNSIASSLPYVELRCGDGAPFANVFRLERNGDPINPDELDCVSFEGGTVLTITGSALSRVSQALPLGCPAYFRFRIYLLDRNPFLTTYRAADWWLHSSYDEVEYVDFRLNENRTLPLSVQKRMQQEWERDRAPISLVAFLTAIPGKSQLSTLNAASYKMRLLEKPIWKKYVPSGIPDGMMVFHWKKVRKDLPEMDWEVTSITELTTFVRLDTRHSSLLLRLLFLIIAFSIGVAGSVAAEWIPIQSKKGHTANCVMKQIPRKLPSTDESELVLSGQCMERR